MNRSFIIISTQNGSVRIFSATAFSLSSEDWARTRQQKRIRNEGTRADID